MAAMNPALRPCLPTLILLFATLVAGLPSAAAAGPPTGAVVPEVGAVEEIYRQRKYADAVVKADELVAAGQVDPANEYWAARALRALKRFDESADRFRAMSRRFPTAPDAPNADVDAEIALLGKVQDGPMDAAARKAAAAAGQRLLAVAKKHESKPDTQARALYIAGNAFRMAQADTEAISSYGSCRTLSAAAATGYPAKCTHGLGTIHARNGENEEARRLYRECSLQQDDSGTSRRCSKSLARMELVGLPAPELEVETWIHGTPHPLASLKGKVVMLFFFATWCPHCKATLPTLPDYLAKFEGQPFEILAITNNARGQTTESAKLFVQDPQWKIDYPVAVDAGGATTVAMEASGIPQIILIDKKGIVRWSDHPAYLTDGMIERLIAEPGGA